MFDSVFLCRYTSQASHKSRNGRIPSNFPKSNLNTPFQAMGQLSKYTQRAISMFVFQQFPNEMWHGDTSTSVRMSDLVWLQTRKITKIFNWKSIIRAIGGYGLSSGHVPPPLRLPRPAHTHTHTHTCTHTHTYIHTPTPEPATCAHNVRDVDD